MALTVTFNVTFNVTLNVGLTVALHVGLHVALNVGLAVALYGIACVHYESHSLLPIVFLLQLPLPLELQGLHASPHRLYTRTLNAAA